MNHMQKVRKWEKAWGEYIRSLVKLDETESATDGRVRYGARKSHRVACRKLRAVDAEVSE